MTTTLSLADLHRIQLALMERQRHLAVQSDFRFDVSESREKNMALYEKIETMIKEAEEEE